MTMRSQVKPGENCSTCGKQAIDLKAMLAAALALSEKRREMLEKHQWVDWDESLKDWRCPCCSWHKGTGHAPNCELARLIKEKR